MSDWYEMVCSYCSSNNSSSSSSEVMIDKWLVTAMKTFSNDPARLLSYTQTSQPYHDRNDANGIQPFMKQALSSTILYAIIYIFNCIFLVAFFVVFILNNSFHWFPPHDLM